MATNQFQKQVPTIRGRHLPLHRILFQFCHSLMDHIQLLSTDIIGKLELQRRQAPPSSSWDTGRVAALIFSPGVKSLN